MPGISVRDILGITQPSLSKIENEDDMQIGTLNKRIVAMGGKLEIIARPPRIPDVTRGCLAVASLWRLESVVWFRSITLQSTLRMRQSSG